MLRLPKFRYLQPKSLDEAVRMMSDGDPTPCSSPAAQISIPT